jgi:hypothetical protein
MKTKGLAGIVLRFAGEAAGAHAKSALALGAQGAYAFRNPPCFMNPNSLMPFAFIAFFLGLIGFAIVMIRRQQRQTLENLTKLANRLGLELNRQPAKLGFEPTPSVEGRHRGRPVRFFAYTTGSGKSRRAWSAVSAAVPGAGAFVLELVPENFLTRVATALGMQDIQIGDPTFDRAFIVRSNDAASAAAALLPEIRARLIAAFPRVFGGELTVKAGAVRYAEGGGLGDAACVARLEAMLEMVCDLAEVAEALPAP